MTAALRQRRFTIVGNSGSGKSTLGERLGREISIPVRHLDLILWRSSWVYCEEGRCASLHDAWLLEHEWLIEGVGHWPSLLRRFAAAQLIVFVDTPRELCLERAHLRMAEERMAPNRFIAEGCRYADVVGKQLEVIQAFDTTMRPALLRLLEKEFRAKPQMILDGSLSIDELAHAISSRPGVR